MTSRREPYCIHESGYNHPCHIADAQPVEKRLPGHIRFDPAVAQQGQLDDENEKEIDPVPPGRVGALKNQTYGMDGKPVKMYL